MHFLTKNIGMEHEIVYYIQETRDLREECIFLL